MVQIKYQLYRSMVCLASDTKRNHFASWVNPKVVPPFSYQSLRPNTRVYPPPRCFPYAQKVVRNTIFRRYFLRGDIPIVKKTPTYKKSTDVFRTQENKSNLFWRIHPSNLDYAFYLPIFFDGLAESAEPFKSLAREGTHELISYGPDKIIAVIPQLIMPIKRALNTRNPDIIVATLKIMQHMVLTVPCFGRAIVPFYRQILPICNLFKNVNVNMRDAIDFKRDFRVGDVIEDTLEILERCGGPDAYINIKYMIPTYESLVRNST